jgi:hypothetical protein
MLLKHHDKNLAKVLIGAVNSPHSVPGVALVSEYQAAVMPGVCRALRVKILERRSIILLDPCDSFTLVAS